MKTSRYFGWFVRLMLWWGSTGSALASSDAGVPPAASDAGVPGSSVLLARCEKDFARVVREEWSSPVTRKQTRALLSGLSTACVEVLPATLREGAAEAAALRGAERSQRLVEAARSFMPEGCLTPSGTSTRLVESRCSPPKDFPEPSIQTDLDTGTYVFALAVRSQLASHGAYGDRAQRWVLEFLLRSMIENEDRRKQGSR